MPIIFIFAFLVFFLLGTLCYWVFRKVDMSLEHDERKLNRDEEVDDEYHKKYINEIKKH